VLHIENTVKTLYKFLFLYSIIGQLLTNPNQKHMASIIDPESAKSLIQEYRQQNSSDGGPGIKTTEGHFLHGYFLDRESLETILKDPNVQGVSLHLAKHPDSVGSEHNHFTLLWTGAEPNTQAGATAKYVNKGAIFQGTPPCPTVCGEI
jgi:hypothetical protein